MLQSASPRSSPARELVLEPDERAALLAIARAALPAGERFAPAGAGAVEVFLRDWATAPGWVQVALKGALRALDGWARLRHRRHLAALSDEEVLSILEAWRHGDWVRRALVRLLTAPLKLAHFSDARLYQGGRQGGRPLSALPKAEPPPPAWERQRIVAAASLEGDEVVDCDVVVVGSGAGGAVVAKELAEAGRAVVLIEEGDYHRRGSFSGRTAETQRRLYRDHGATLSFGNVVIPIPVGRAVGGTTLVNGGTCYRTPERILRRWARDFGLDGLCPEAMAPHFERVEAVLEVAPAPAAHLGGVARVIARGCTALGYRHGPLRRNAPGCDGQGLCYHGCPTDAKRSTNVSYVPLALKAGATLFTGVRVERVMIDRGHAGGVLGRFTDGLGRERRLRVQARATVVACGTLITPLLLEASGVGDASGQLGRNLSLHPALGVMALFDETIDGGHAIPQGYAIEEFRDEGLLFEGAFVPIDLAAATLPHLGPTLVALLERYDRLAAFGAMIEDVSRGRVRPGPGGRPLISYSLLPEDVRRLQRAVAILSEVYFAAGARAVIPPVAGFDLLTTRAALDRLRRTRLRARDLELSAYHPLGTARMGSDPQKSVVGPDQQLHDVAGLFVADGSVVPGSPGVNPQVTIMALATRAATLIDRWLD